MRSGISGPRHRAVPTTLPIHSSQAVTTTVGGEDTNHQHHRNGGTATTTSSSSRSSHGKTMKRIGFLCRVAIKCRNMATPFLPLVAFLFVFWISFLMPLSQLKEPPSSSPLEPQVASTPLEDDASTPRVVPHQTRRSASQAQDEETPRITTAQNDESSRSTTKDHSVSSLLNAAAGPASPNIHKDNGNGNKRIRRILSLYLESPSTLDVSTIPLPRRKTSAAKLTKLEFPHASSSCPAILEHFPVNDFPVDDPYLPWIHDYFVKQRQRPSSMNSNNNNTQENNNDTSWQVQFVAQNKRRCETGKGKDIIMKHWEPQMSLFQPVPVLAMEEEQGGNSSTTDSSTNTNTIYKLSSLENATHPETRFLCQFHHDQPSTAANNGSSTTTSTTSTITTLSVYPFNYEFVTWRKHKATPMFVETGRDVEKFEFSQLLFACPIPPSMIHSLLLLQQQQQESSSSESSPNVWLDVIPIRTPARRESMLLSPTLHARQDALRDSGVRIFNTTYQFGTNHVLPRIVDSGRWANLPICLPPISRNDDAKLDLNSRDDAGGVSAAARSLTNAGTTVNKNNSQKPQKQHYFVACTWTAAAYQRRGDATTVSDSEDRLREWILFHKTVGLDHLYIYDNTDSTTTTSIRNSSSSSKATTTEWTSPLKAVVQEFAQDDFGVTYISWHATVCSNNRPNHANPGERSSQYAAEASCRERYGSDTEWMAFIDTDEYLVPMMGSSSGNGINGTTSSSRSNDTISWKPLLELKKQQGYHVLKMRSTRGRPREDLMVVPADTAAACVPHNRRQEHLATDPCLVPRANETFLRVYNCDYIKPPLPDRFQRAMKQIYRPAFVLSHFVHYSTITAGMARYFPETTSTTTTNKTTGTAAGAAVETITRELKQSDWGDVFLDDLTEGRLIHAKTVLPHETMTRNRTCYLHSKNPCIVGRACPESTLFRDEDHTKNIFVDEQGKFCNCWINAHVEHNLIPRLEAALASHNENRQRHRGGGRRLVAVDADEADAARVEAQNPD